MNSIRLSTLILSIIASSSLSIYAHASDEDLHYRCMSQTGKGLDIAIEQGVLPSVLNVAQTQRGSDAVNVIDRAPNQQYVNLHESPSRIDFRYINDGGESTLKLESIDQTAVKNPKNGLVLRFDANVGILKGTKRETERYNCRLL